MEAKTQVCSKNCRSDCRQVGVAVVQVASEIELLAIAACNDLRRQFIDVVASGHPMGLCNKNMGS